MGLKTVAFTAILYYVQVKFDHSNSLIAQEIKIPYEQTKTDQQLIRIHGGCLDLYLVELGGLNDRVVLGDLCPGQGVVVEGALVLVAVAVEGAEDATAPTGEERQTHLLPASHAPSLLGRALLRLLLLRDSLGLLLQFEFLVHLLCGGLQLLLDLSGLGLLHSSHCLGLGRVVLEELLVAEAAEASAVGRAVEAAIVGAELGGQGLGGAGGGHVDTWRAGGRLKEFGGWGGSRARAERETGRYPVDMGRLCPLIFLSLLN